MGILNEKRAAATITFGGIREYATSGTEERPIRAHFDFGTDADARFGYRPALATMIPLSAAHLLRNFRSAPMYAAPFMALVENVHAGVLESGGGTDFRVRDQVVTDPEDLTISVMGLGDGAIAEAQLNSSIPVLQSDPIGEVERKVSLRLMIGRRAKNPWTSFVFPMRSSNPLTTIGAWCAAVEHGIREWPVEEVAIPACAALGALSATWHNLGEPSSLPLDLTSSIEALLAEVVAADDPQAAAREALAA